MTTTAAKAKPTNPSPVEALGSTGLHATVDRKALAAVFGEIARTAPAKPGLPILRCVLLRADEDGFLHFSANDLTRQVSAKLPGTVTTVGALCVDARTLAEWINIQDQAATVTFRLEPNTNPAFVGKCVVSCGRGSAKLSTMDPADWPADIHADFASGTEISIGGQELKEAIGLVVICAAADDTRPILSGVLLRAAKGHVTFAAADGFRLAIRELEIAEQSDLQVVIPAKALEEVAKLIDDEDAPVHISLAGNYVRFETPSYTLDCRTLEGQFPAYERIIPSDPKTIVQAATQTLLRGVRAALVSAADSSVRFTRSDPLVEPTCLIITSTDSESSTLDEVSATFTDTGEGVQSIAVNGKYVQQMLRAMPTDTVQWQLTASNSPLILKPVGSNGYIQVLMPMFGKGNS